MTELCCAACSAGSQALLLDALARKGAEASCKTTFIIALLQNHIQEGHRTLVFSQSRVMLDIIQVLSAAAAKLWPRPFGASIADPLLQCFPSPSRPADPRASSIRPSLTLLVISDRERHGFAVCHLPLQSVLRCPSWRF